MFLGTARAFDLKKYQQKTGKDNKRIVLYLCSIEDRHFVDHMGVPSLPGHAWIETQPPIKKESVSVLQVDTDEEYAKILQRKYDNEGGILFGDQQVQSVGCNKTSKYRNLYRLKNLTPSQS